MKKNVLVLGFLLLTALAASATDEVYRISFQGKIEQLPSQTVTMKFELFPVGKSEPVWTQNTAILTDAQGIFNVILGETGNELTDSYLTMGESKGVNLQISYIDQTNTFVPLNPPQPLTAAPYAMLSRLARKATLANTATNLRGGNIVFNNTSTTTPDAVEGTMYYNTTSKRVAYYDNTKWIEIDPAYTKNPVKMTAPVNYNITSGNEYNSGILPANNVIIVGWSGRFYQLGATSVKVEVYNSGTGIFSSQAACSSAPGVTSSVYFPIPIRSDSNRTTTKMKLTGNGTAGNNVFVYDFMLYYIDLPL